MCFISFTLLKNLKKKPSKTPHTSLLMLDASNDNSWATTKSSLIKSYKLSEISIFKKSFGLIVIVTFKALESNQCPRDWFNTLTLTTEDKTSIIF